MLGILVGMDQKDSVAVRPAVPGTMAGTVFLGDVSLGDFRRISHFST